MRNSRGLLFALVVAGGGLGLAFFLAGCGGEVDGGMSISATQEGLGGCRGTAGSSVPASGSYYLTSFGFTPSDNGIMSCGEYTKNGSWYYAASRQRYGCGAHLQIEANGKCVVAETDDYGPDVCVENAAGRPIIDASPLVSEHLFGTRSAGWSDRLAIQVTLVSKSTPLGPCSSTGGGGSGSDGGSGGDSGSGGGTPTPLSCSSATLGRSVPAGSCVQSRSDGNWYTCEDGAWVAGEHDCTTAYPL